MYRRGILNLITVVSIVLVLSLPLYLKFVAYPSYKSFLATNTEKALEKLATNLVENHFSLNKHLSDQPLNMSLISDHLIEEIHYYQEITGIPKVKIFSTKGVIVYSSDPDDIGNPTSKTFFQQMLQDGKPRSELKVTPAEGDNEQTQYLLEAYVPIFVDGNAIGAFELYYDITDLNASLEDMKQNEQKILIPVIILLLSGGIISAWLARRSINELARTKDQFQKLSTLDPLTGLLNRRGFNSAAQTQLNRSVREGNHCLMIYIDLNDFKQINDTFGHDTGDQALIDATKILSDVFRETDLIGRTGGDEFSVLATAVKLASDEQHVRSRLQEALDRWNAGSSQHYSLSFSVGLSAFDPKAPTTLEVLIAQADANMYQQKKLHKNRSAVPEKH